MRVTGSIFRTLVGYVAVVGAVAATTAPSAQAQATGSGSRWSGFYAGIIVGNSQLDVSPSLSTDNRWFAPGDLAAIKATSVGQNLNGNAWGIGGQVGYNRQFGSFVAGIEADLTSSHFNKSATSTVQYPSSAPSLTLTQSVSQNYLGTLRGRIGVNFSDLLLYATGGLAYGNVNFGRVFGDTVIQTAGTATSSVLVGYAIGGGAEYAITRNLSLKGELMHIDLGSIKNGGPLSAGGVVQVQMFGRAEIAQNIARVGLNYHF